MRVTGFNIAIISQWLDPRDTERGMQWARDTYAALRPFFAPTRYVNYLEDDVDGDAAATVYGPNYARLRKVKAQVRSRQLLPRQRQHPALTRPAAGRCQRPAFTMVLAWPGQPY